MAEYRLLEEFRRLFEGKKYVHRRSNAGDFVAMHLYEDLMAINKSEKYALGVSNLSEVLNVHNKRTGVDARRGDGTFGELIIGEKAQVDPGYKVARGPVATVEIGVEVKVLLKAMIKQIDRVQNDLTNQVKQFKKKSGLSDPICVAVIGINHADVTTGYEGDRSYRTDGKKEKHPIQEAEKARLRLKAVEHEYFEFLILRFRATNEGTYPFEWVDEKEAVRHYVSALMRISNEYQRRF